MRYWEEEKIAPGTVRKLVFISGKKLTKGQNSRGNWVSDKSEGLINNDDYIEDQPTLVAQTEHVVDLKYGLLVIKTCVLRNPQMDLDFPYTTTYIALYYIVLYFHWQCKILKNIAKKYQKPEMVRILYRF